MKIFEIDAELETEVRGENVELSVMEVIETDQGTFFTGYNHTALKGFIHQVGDIPELEGANYSAARRNMTPEVVARVMEESQYNRLELNGDVDRTRFIKDLMKGYDNCLSEGAAASMALLEQYEQIPADRRDDIVLRKSFDDVLTTLEKTYPDGPKSAAELSSSKSRRDPFEHDFGVIDTNRGTVTSAPVASLDQ